MYDKKSIDYQYNIEMLHEIEEYIPMTKREREYLRKWVYQGNCPENNPWDYKDSDGFPLTYLHAFRLKYGYSCGPWDSWQGIECPPNWDEKLKCFLEKDEMY